MPVTHFDLTLKRHRDGQAIFKAIGDAAPAMGMIGTLIGLVQMLGSMNDPKQIAPAKTGRPTIRTPASSDRREPGARIDVWCPRPRSSAAS